MKWGERERIQKFGDLYLASKGGTKVKGGFLPCTNYFRIKGKRIKIGGRACPTWDKEKGSKFSRGLLGVVKGKCIFRGNNPRNPTPVKGV